jgi:hypothetical protein
MRRALVVVGVVASAVVTPPARLAVVGVVALSAVGCQKTCEVDITTQDPLPDGRVGQPYFVQMTAAGECVQDGAFWLASGLPSGMKFSRDGALDGTPTEDGTYTLHISAGILDINDEYKGDPSDRRDFKLTILPRS